MRLTCLNSREMKSYILMSILCLVTENETASVSKLKDKTKETKRPYKTRNNLNKHFPLFLLFICTHHSSAILCQRNRNFLPMNCSISIISLRLKSILKTELNATQLTRNKKGHCIIFLMYLLALYYFTTAQLKAINKLVLIKDDLGDGCIVREHVSRFKVPWEFHEKSKPPV